ncbi:MAG: DNA-directed RNA polymerase subunit alpha C-terminal domain-containing protein [Planctomycetota bacterium]
MIEPTMDLDRALDGAVADVGEAMQLRLRAESDTQLRRGLKNRVEGTAVMDAENDPTLASRRAVAHFILGNDEEVGPYASKGESHRVQFLWGLAELYQNDPIAALAAFEKTVSMEPRDERARLQLAALLALLGRGDDARETLGELVDQQDRAQVLYVLGTIAEADGEYDQAERQYQSALVQDPEHVDSLFRLAYQHDLAGDDDAAIMLYERARHAKPTRVNVLVNLGVLYEDKGEYKKASECYRQVLRSDPTHPRAKAFMRDADSSVSMVVDDDLERKEDRRNQLLQTPVTDFELSVRSRNCLAKMSIRTLGDLIQRTEAELLSYKNFGETSLQEIKDILGSKGLRLGMRREEVIVVAPEVDEMPDIPAMPDVPGAAAMPAVEGEGAAKLGTPIADLDLSVRSSKCMSLLSVQTVGELLNYSESDLLKTKNFGQTSLAELRTKLAALGLALRK